MLTLFDFITLNSTSFDQLTETQKDRLEMFVQRIREKGLEEKVLYYAQQKYMYDITEQPQEPTFIHETNLPDDLSNEMDQVWSHLSE